MIRFVRRTMSVLDRPARLRFMAFAILSVVVAAIEAAGVATIIPLTELLVGGEQSESAVRLVDRVLNVSTPGQAATVLAVCVLVAFTVKAVAAIALLRWAIGNSLRQEATIARRLFARYLSAPATYHFNHNSSEVQRTLNEALLLVFRRSLPWVLAAAADAFVLIAIAVVIAINDPAIALLAVGYFAIVALAYQRWIGGRQKVAARRSHKDVAVRYQQVQEPMYAAKDLAILHRTEYFVERFYRTKLQLADTQRLLLFFQLLPRQFLDIAFVVGAGLMALLLFATRSVDEALVGVGLFLAASFRLVAPLNRVMNAVTVSRTAEPAIGQVIDDLAALEAFELPPEDGDQSPLPPSAIELLDVHYRYAADLPEVLTGISLRIEPRDDVAIVGATGAGKTTLLDLLLGVLEPQSGSVLVGGAPIASCRTAWQLSIGYVPQQVVLIDDTIRANVAFGIPPEEIDDDRIWEALRLAQIDSYVATLAETISTAIGEQGVRLSGGQRQRLGLARALYHRPSVLVLDEATSSLDTGTEARVMETIARLRGALTIITVSHRLSTLQHCDRVYFLRDGSIGSVGSFDDLRAREPEFARLLELAELAPSAGVNV
ncbi:MAG: ABC transporter ATP-binding protein [Geodermatophilaceae bacterium]|nr:ABC transporter ATP-binding protein [Geodermatophilaceae bacterium]